MGTDPIESSFALDSLMGSDGKGEAGGNSSDYISALAAIASDYYAQTQPIQTEVFSGLESFMQGDYDVSENPAWESSKRALEDQYGVAQESILSTLPEGGVLQESLADLETERAQGLGDLAAQIALDEYNKAYGVATLSPQTSMSGYTSAAEESTNLYAAETAEQGMLLDFFSTMIGK